MRAILTGKQLANLRAAYRSGGIQAAKPLAIEYGISPKSVRQICRRAGIEAFPRPVVSQIMRGRAKMWERAKANGPVIA